MILAFDDEAAFAQALARKLGRGFARIARHRFPDGELKLRLPAALPERVVLLRGLHQPNEKLVELLLAARTARELGARELTLVAPYLAYMRQDIAFAPGEAVSQRIVGRFLAELFDGVVTVDPHLHRIAHLDEILPGRRGLALSAAPLLGAWVARVFAAGPAPLLLGPDEEAGQWVAQAARVAGLEGATCRKLRRGDRAVEVALPALDLRGRAVVLVDDMASTGHTLAEAARAVLAAGARSADVAVTHALFDDGAGALLAAAGVGRVWSTDTVAHPSNALTVRPLLAAALGRA